MLALKVSKILSYSQKYNNGDNTLNPKTDTIIITMQLF